MNFLAHLFLAEPSPESRMGNLLGDFVKGMPWDDRFEPVIWKGIMEHRHIDAFTDSHPVWKESRDLLDPDLRRFAGIVIDIFYDHFLTIHWETYSPEHTVEEFIAETYADLRKAKHHATDNSYPIIQQMMEENWLGNYRTIEGIRETVERVSRRTVKLSSIRDSTDQLVKHFQKMEEHFLDFFPDMLQFINARRAAGKDESP